MHPHHQTIAELEAAYEALSAKAAKAHRDATPEAARELNRKATECIREIRRMRGLP